MQEVLNLGYACPWDTPRVRTWSGTPWHLQQALEANSGVEIVDLPISISPVLKTIARVRGLYRERGQWQSRWHYTPAVVNAYRKSLQSQVSDTMNIDAVLSVGEFGSVAKPLFIYQDFSFLHAIRLLDETGIIPSQFAAFPREMIRERAARQQETFDSAAGIFTMSDWDAQAHVKHGFVPSEKIFNVGAGFNAMVSTPRTFEELDRSSSRERRVLFVGRDFYRKGGDAVVEAVGLWRKRVSYPVRLTVAGPRAWPMDGPVPAFVNFLSDVPKSTIASELSMSDVSTLPSHFEAFGIAIVESLAAGIPFVGRNVCAMPELVDVGKTGHLVETHDPEELSVALERIANDDGIRATTIERIPQVVQRFSWAAVGDAMTKTMRERLA